MILRAISSVPVWLRQRAAELNDSFWLRPALMAAAGISLAELLIGLDRHGVLPSGFVADWLYSGGETGARTLLGAVAGSTIAVAGTLFSITIAALTLASNQMGPRLLRNFTRDRGNQVTLGALLGTFAYALMALRTVRGDSEGAFVPHLATTGAIVLALACVAMLIFFVHHVATRINSETVIELVYQDLHARLMKQTTQEKPPASPAQPPESGGRQITDARCGFIQQLDENSIADWAAAHDACVRLSVRAGSFVFPGAPIGTVTPAHDDANEIICSALVLGAGLTASSDMEFAVTQLADIATRALSPGINDPITAIRVIDHLGAALCVIASRHLPSGVVCRDGRVLLQRSTTTYAGLTDVMFHPIRQHGTGSPAVLIRMIEVLTKVAQCERCTDRLRELARHGELVLADAVRGVGNTCDFAELRERCDLLFQTIAATGRQQQKTPPER